MPKESEETEVKKDLNWFKEQLDDIEMNTPRLWSQDSIWMLDRVNELLNQLDEPEVLSQEWIDGHTYHEDEYDFYYADPDELKNLLVPKQEKVKIDKEDAKNIEQYKSMGWRLTHLVNDTGASASHDELLARAWLDGYTVEEEQKYYVVLEENDFGAVGLGEGIDGSLTFAATDSINGLSKLTEQEIKDYDYRFWAFAVKVEEMEE